RGSGCGLAAARPGPAPQRCAAARFFGCCLMRFVRFRFFVLTCLDRCPRHRRSESMFKGMRKALVATAVTGMTLFGAAHAAELKELNFGIISTESSQNLKAQWDPFLADMGKQTGMKINAYFAPDYAGIIQGMRFDKVDVAWYGNKSA